VEKKGCVVCNGEIGDYEMAKKRIASCDVIIAADGGYRHLQAMGIVPDAIVGDMDSIGDDFQPETDEIEIIRFPEKKDETDAQLAVEIAFNRGCKDVILVGAVGGRVDHFLGNMSLLTKYPGRLSIVDEDAMLIVADAAHPFEFRAKPTSVVSLIPVPFAKQVTTEGLQYALLKQDMTSGTRGISNVLRGSRGKVRLEGGLLLVYVDRWRA